MTTIFWAGDKVFADSGIVKGAETFESLTKINAFPQPLHLISSRYSVRDLIYGWVCTGALKPAQKLIDSLPCANLFDKVLHSYEKSHVMGLCNIENLFEVVLIGRKANYSVCFDPLQKDEVFSILPHKKGFVLGSGSEYLIEILTKYGKCDPVRLMYAIYDRDVHSTGLIDVWQFKDSPLGATFQRIGVCRGLENRNVGELLSNMAARYHYDWVINHRNPPLLPLKPKKPVDLTKLKGKTKKGHAHAKAKNASVAAARKADREKPQRKRSGAGPMHRSAGRRARPDGS